MEQTVELQEHYGAVVWTHTEMDKLRKTECLCRLCADLVIGEEPDENCKIASALYAICKAGDIAMSVTRCKNYQPRARVN